MILDCKKKSPRKITKATKISCFFVPFVDNYLGSGNSLNAKAAYRLYGQLFNPIKNDYEN